MELVTDIGFYTICFILGIIVFEILGRLYHKTKLPIYVDRMNTRFYEFKRNMSDVPSKRKWYHNVFRKIFFPHTKQLKQNSFTFSFKRNNLWYKKYKKLRPLRYFFSNTVRRDIKKYYNMYRLYLNYYIIKRPYIIINKFPKPEYYEANERILYSSFQVFNDFIEKEFCVYLDSNGNKITKDNIKSKVLQFLKEEYESRLSYYNSSKNTSKEPLYYIEYKRSKDFYEMYLWWNVLRPNRRRMFASNTGKFFDFEFNKNYTEYVSHEDEYYFMKLSENFGSLWF